MVESEIHLNMDKNASLINSPNADIVLEPTNIPHSKSNLEYEGINSVFIKTEFNDEISSPIDDGGGEDDHDPLCTLIKDSDVLVKLEESDAADDSQRKSPGEEAYDCPQCPYKTYSKRYLRQHSKIHEHQSEEEFRCQFCCFTSTSESSLEEHISIHTRVKVFCCELCPYKSGSVSILKKHILSHTGEKPYSCKYCDFKTTRASNLKSHIMCHTGEKPFGCERCSYRTNQKSALKRHIFNNKEIGKPYSCEHCVFKSCAKSTFKSHVSTHNAE